MVRNEYQFTMSFLKEDGAALGQIPLSPDFVPAQECLHFSVLRKGMTSGWRGDVVMDAEPVWDSEAGQPYLTGFRLHSPDNGTGEVMFPARYFAPVAHQYRYGFVQNGDLKAGESLRYVVTAQPRESGSEAEPERGATDAPRSRIRTKKVAAPLTVRESTLDTFAEGSTPHGETGPGDHPVFIPAQVLYEVAALTQEAGAQETGGVLIGHLHHDSHVPELFVQVTAQIPAAHTESGLTRLTFTAETWTAARAAIDLRGQGEIMVGWRHSHSYMKETCKDCEKSKDQSCRETATFMSLDDLALQRCVFPAAFSLALVVSDSPCTGLTWELFGWRTGIIEARGFCVLGVQDLEARAAIQTAATEGDSHAER